MSRVYDNWERLVGAVLKREELRRTAFASSFSTSISADSSSGETIYIAAAAHSSPIISSYLDVQPIKFKEIRKATKNFQSYMLLPIGRFTQVYKGWIDEHTLTASEPGSGVAVAVKKWNLDGLKWHRNCRQVHQEWLTEIHYLSRLRHPNLVRLIGHCSKKANLISVYEFVPKGSLCKHLFKRGHDALSWATRIKVATGVARALCFLHNLATPVLHRCCQSSNILLDGEFNAKLCNFGLARDGPIGNMTRVTGYFSMSHEYVMTGCLTAKCDVYDFGILLLELLSGRRVSNRIMAGKKQKLVESAKPYLVDKRKLLLIMDARLEGQYTDDQAYNVAKLALRCLSTRSRKRPRMADIVLALEQL